MKEWVKESEAEKSMQRCKKWGKCNAPICPLDLNISFRYMARNEKVCPYILDYLEGKETLFPDEIKDTEEIWRKKIGESVIRGKLKSRVKVREYFGQKRAELGIGVEITSKSNKELLTI